MTLTGDINRHRILALVPRRRRRARQGRSASLPRGLLLCTRPPARRLVHVQAGRGCQAARLNSPGKAPRPDRRRAHLHAGLTRSVQDQAGRGLRRGQRDRYHSCDPRHFHNGGCVGLADGKNVSRCRVSVMVFIHYGSTPQPGLSPLSLSLAGFL